MNIKNIRDCRDIISINNDLKIKPLSIDHKPEYKLIIENNGYVYYDDDEYNFEKKFK